MNNKVLIITNEFIPYTQSLGGVIRVLSLSNYLINNNFEVHLLSTKSVYKSYYGYEHIFKKLNVHFVNSNQISNNFFFKKINFFVKIIKKIILMISYNFYQLLSLFVLLKTKGSDLSKQNLLRIWVPNS